MVNVENVATRDFLHSTSRMGITDHNATRLDDCTRPLPYLLVSVTPIFFHTAVHALAGRLTRVELMVEDTAIQLTSAYAPVSPSPLRIAFMRSLRKYLDKNSLLAIDDKPP